MTAEEQLLGICFKIGTCEEIIGKLRKQDFSSDKTWFIYKEMCKMQEEFGHISCAVVGERIGDLEYLQRITNEAPEMPSLIPTLVYRMREYGWKKDIASSLDPAKLRSMSGGEIKEVLDRKADTYPLSAVDSFKLSEFLQKVCESMENIKEGIMSTGIITLDDHIGGLHKGKLYILAGRPSQGKTSLAVNIAINLLFEGKRVLIYPFEGGAENYTKRILCRICRIDNKKVWKAQLTDEEWEKLVDGVCQLSDKQLIYPTQISAPYYIISEQIQYYKPDLVIFDYLQLAPLSGIKEDTHNLKLGFLVYKLKNYAIKYNTCIFCLSQVNRKVEDLTPPIPNLSHLRDCGEIEQAGDVIMGIYNPAFYGRENEEGPGILIKVLKNRDGIAGQSFNLAFIPQYYEIGDLYGKE